MRQVKTCAFIKLKLINYNNIIKTNMFDAMKAESAGSTQQDSQHLWTEH